MIEVKELTKVYKSRRSGTCVALDHISFTLPDKGFVFIIGKSGSGKTTLLSLLGGLDTITSGDIIENGRSFADFKHRDQVYYRNSTIGFIFQDFHLLDDLTIYDNIMFALQLHGEENREKVLKAIADTDLNGFENRYPKELSGGQKQRVAIARALVKEPSIILADEPTGNLDSKTTTQVLDLLKKLSEEKLVVIVSHNLPDARAYADEIIELSDGHIVQHVRRNEEFNVRLRIEDDTLILPCGQEFSEENIREVSDAMKSNKVKNIKQDTDRFYPCAEQDGNKNAASTSRLQKKHLKFRYTSKIAVKMARRSWVKMTVYSVLIAMLMTVLGLSQLIMNFNGNEVVIKEMNKRNLDSSSFIKDTSMAYESVDATRIVDVEEGDLQKFYDAGYEGEAYPIINYPLYITGEDSSTAQKRFKPRSNPYNFGYTAGVLITEESFLEKVFGELEYAALSDKPKDYGVYITDFIADAYMINHPARARSYNDMLGTFTGGTRYTYAYINGVIKTGYKERYKELIDTLTDPNVAGEDLKEIARQDDCMALHDEISQYLAVAYSFDPDFADNPNDPKNFISTGRSTFEYNNVTYSWSGSSFAKAKTYNSKPLNDNEMVMNYTVYNSVFGKSYTEQNLSEFEPHEVKFSYYQLCDETRSQKKYETTLKIVGLTSGKNAANSNLADNVYKELRRFDKITFGYYFENSNKAEMLFDVASENGFLPNSVIGGSIVIMARAVKVFADFFNLIFIMLCVCILVLLVQFGVKNIKERMKDIGIIKALGGRDTDLTVIFGFQTLVVGILMTVLYIIASFVFIGVANHILLLSLVKIAQRTIVVNIDFLVVKWLYIAQNCGLAIVIIAVAFIVPMLSLHNVKPTNVIKARE